ncbi:MAG: hypothetical protein ACF8NJ_10660 [Phycisphaerales bacterium JB038]
MLLTLGPNSIHRLLSDKTVEVEELRALPAYCRDFLGLRGLSVPAGLLSGWSARDIDQLRDRADKCDCPCLLLVDEEPLPLASPKGDEVDAALHRLERLLRAGHRLGANSIAFSIKAKASDSALGNAIVACKAALESAERLEVNMLISPQTGLTEDPERLGTLIKKVGGFRLGTFPDFLSACASEDPVTYMRRLTPYGGAVNASFKTGDEPLNDLMQAVLSVGYSGAISIDAHGNGELAADLKSASARLWSIIEGDDGK